MIDIGAWSSNEEETGIICSKWEDFFFTVYFTELDRILIFTEIS